MRPIHMASRMKGLIRQLVFPLGNDNPDDLCIIQKQYCR